MNINDVWCLARKLKNIELSMSVDQDGLSSSRQVTRVTSPYAILTNQDGMSLKFEVNKTYE